MQVEVYYEVLCPDSRYFVLEQVLKSWEMLNSIMDIHFKPYGKASVSSEYYTIYILHRYVQYTRVGPNRGKPSDQKAGRS